MEQQIGFCTASDGVRIAYATLGVGPPLVYAGGAPTHLEIEWGKRISRAFLEALAEGCTLVRYDMRGSGLSDHDVSDLSLKALVQDLEAVVDHLALDRFAVLSLGALAGPTAITYAAAHPQRVTHLILSSAFLRGAEITSPERQQAIIQYVSQFGLPFDLMIPRDVDASMQRDIRDVQRTAASREAQVALLKAQYAADVSELAGQLSMPALVFHGREDRLVPFALGREVAARIPRARFVPFEGNSSLPATVSHIIIPEVHRFLGIEVKLPEVPSASAQGLVTVLFTDIEGSTELTERLGDAAGREVLRAYEQIVRDALREHGGQEIKALGDGFMACFPSASSALQCAIAVQRAFAARDEERPEAPVRVRIGLNAGEPIAEDGDLFGTAVNLASRIAAQASGGEIFASDVVRQLAAGKGFLFADRGETALRGFEDAVRIFEVGWQA